QLRRRPCRRRAGDEGLPRDRRQRPRVRAFLVRAVRHLAGEAGIRQFLDIGTGLPTANNTHQAAQAVAPEFRIVYLDNDPRVLAPARALLARSPKGVTDYIDAGARDTDKILREAVRTVTTSSSISGRSRAGRHGRTRPSMTLSCG